VVLDKNEVVVSTGQVLLNLLDKGSEYLALERLSLVVFDECHNCVKKHPYSKIMEKYRMAPEGSSRPRIFGLTVSSLGMTDRPARPAGWREARLRMRPLTSRRRMMMNMKMKMMRPLTWMRAARPPPASPWRRT
jgi:endoribonuclease Dicer